MTTTTTLHTGAVVATPLVATVGMILRRLLDEGAAVPFYEAAMIARDASHRPFGRAGADLEKAGLLEGGRMHQSIRDVIVASVEGEGFDMKMRSPV